MFVSYAQNFEDVLLWRALKDVREGFYVDVGAQDPRIDSVSRGFYEQGWRGLSVEPTQTYADKLRADRPGERVIQAAVGSGSGEIVFHEFPDTGLSTADEAIAAGHVANGYARVLTRAPVTSLDAILREAGRADVHWLKIDVEGRETDVLRSWADNPTRPWIVVVESTAPLTQAQTHAQWEGELTSRGYRFAHFDGVNRYYVAQAHAERAACFGPGPNFFDGFQMGEGAAATHTLVRDLRAEALQALADERARANARLAALHAANADESAARAEAERRLAELRASTSWRLTAPFRVAVRAARGDYASLAELARSERALAAKRAGRAGLARFVDFARERPALKRVVLTTISLSPRLRVRLEAALLREREARAQAAEQRADGRPDFVLTVERDKLEAWRDLVARENDKNETK